MAQTAQDTPDNSRQAPTVQSIALALPPYTFSAEEAEAQLRGIFEAQGEDPAIVSQMVRNSGIKSRFLARPPSFYLEERGLTARNGAFQEVAVELGVAAARQALDEAGLRPDEVDLIIDTSCTGVMIPALDVYVANALELRADVRRMPLTEAGCAAGATSMAFASDYLRGRPDAVVLLLSVELPSLTLQLDDATRANVVSAAIFGDGAAAVVLSNRPAKQASFEHLAHTTVLFPNTQEIMGFDLRSEGFKIILSRRIPLLVKRELRGQVDAFLERQGLSLKEIGFFVLHPGGTKVLDNVRDVLDLSEEQVGAARRTLATYGNLSSASVHFVAHELLARDEVLPGQFGLTVAMGPGFTLELALLRGVK
ncbi:MAG: type III polyketide synthase [Planctomycetes bacterium]|nr:type III polyketide synthase [Planctomycetota bacterium]